MANRRSMCLLANQITQLTKVANQITQLTKVTNQITQLTKETNQINVNYSNQSDQGKLQYPIKSNQTTVTDSDQGKAQQPIRSRQTTATNQKTVNKAIGGTECCDVH